MHHAGLPSACSLPRLRQLISQSLAYRGQLDKRLTAALARVLDPNLTSGRLVVDSEPLQRLHVLSSSTRHIRTPDAAVWAAYGGGCACNFAISTARGCWLAEDHLKGTRDLGRQ
jgi:hypothetical protein